ncbi:disintegrin and metalloproteinase domain-containing protein 2 [Pteropus alecto]|uniref:disintegrin and metalloproteinase domain-containing protein 2 n=1 Tax=Pteropus alecto TaxID=9402 RepID=UPI0003F146A0|nr:disintegrin and metalloproteinase domain-containing protein 2 [Pteropus alecto]
MLCFLLLLIGLIEIQTDHDSQRLRVQITIPEKIRSLTSEGVESHVSYNILIEGKTYTVNLMQKAFLPHNFRVYGYKSTGSMKPFEHQFQNSCYYQGYIEGYPNSMAILSTCTGLRGILQFENVSYGIEPLEPSIGFEHVIYQVKLKNTGSSLFAEEDIEPMEMPYKIQTIEPLTDFSQYIEMHVIVEKNLYNHMGSDTAVVTQKIFQLIGLTNAIFTSFNITIILSSLELWMDENKIPVTGDANELLHRFLKWKRSYLVLRPHDMAFLLVYREKSNYVGATFQGKMCESQYGGGIALHPRTISLESLAVIIAQLLSLSMGIAYDDINKCQCPGAVCIMNPEAIHSSGVKIFSNCSMEDFAHFISKPKSQCLQNQPRLDPSYKAAVCGNKQVEEGEQCDCGTQEECEALPDTCCGSTACVLKQGNTCDSGDCCEHCQFKAKGDTCRASLDECDLPEFCNGSSASCQDNVFIHNGYPCGEKQWLCLDGSCVSGKKQCVEIFGEGTTVGSQECFEYLNSITDRSGNCGSSPSGYKMCNAKDRLCGKLICKYEREHLIDIPDTTIFYSNINGQICVSVEYSSSHADNSKMWIKDGTVCGENKVCKNKECIENTEIVYNCPSSKCNNQGVCNNKDNCHCKPRYLPPNCNTEDESFPGGSIDSGNFPPAGARNPEKIYIENVYHSKPTRWPVFLLIPFFIILCVMIATLVKVYFQRKKWKTEEYTSDEQLESESETKE